MKRLGYAIFPLFVLLCDASTHAAPPIERQPDGIVVPVAGGFLRIQVKTDAVVRVLFSKVRDPRVDPWVVVGTPPTPRWTLRSTAWTATLSTSTLRVTVSLGDGAVTFTDSAGRPILAESGRRMTAAAVQGEATFNVQQSWNPNDDESLYGLGQRQEGKLDLKGYDLDLWQRNTVVEIPFLVSSRGYGLLWDNTSFTKFGDTRPFVPIPAANLLDTKKQPGGLTRGTMNPQSRDVLVAPGADTPTPLIAIGRGGALPVPAARGRGAALPENPAWDGYLVAPASGDYQFQTYSNLGIKVTLDGVRIDHWKQNWATEYDQFKIHLDAGRTYPFTVVSSPGATMELLWKTPVPSPDTSFWSEVGEAVDYYFVYGPELDQVVAGYRTLTGRASMLPRWAYGFWQSKNKYNTQEEVLSIVDEFRTRGIPIDTIVQDWQYWKPDDWGTHQFDPSRYPDPDGMIRAIHDRHARLLISVWGKFYPNTENAKALAAIGALYEPTLKAGTRDWLQRGYTFYDAFSPPARKMFWDQVNTALFSKGVDAWWMDATEPDIVQPSPPTLEALRGAIDKTAAGTASRVMNAYSLLNSEAVYDGQRGVAPDQRVFILTRSGFAGIQRYATVTWSGDITSEWTTLRKQITAGLNFSIAGDPYWTTDTGGYTMQARFTNARDGDALDEWRELNARWFQYSTFTPLLRVHGADRAREMWNLGDESTPVYQAELKYDRLRYALFPYIYSLAGSVTQDGYTMMRPLVMDFRADTRSRDVTDEFMFGPAFLVSPVTVYKARSRQVYLPAGTWYDFWTGARVAGGQTIAADAPYDRMPTHVRAGSIVPLGPEQEYIGQKDAKTLTLVVYAGTNGAFSLYEDDGLTYGYERRLFSRIPLSWNDATRTLTIGARAGSFPGMLTDRTFNVVLVSPPSPIGYSPAAAGRAVDYRGARVDVRF